MNPERYFGNEGVEPEKQPDHVEAFWGNYVEIYPNLNIPIDNKLILIIFLVSKWHSEGSNNPENV